MSALDVNQKAQEANRLVQEKRESASSHSEGAVAQRANQRDIIAQLSALLKRDGQQIEALKEDSARLNTLLTELSRRLADLTLFQGFEDFSSKAGELSAPVKSSVFRLGQKRERGDLRRQAGLARQSR